jgi:hypothetical protein
LVRTAHFRGENEDAKSVMAHAQNEEMIHFGIDLAFLLRGKPRWETVLKNILFKEGDLIELAEGTEKEALDH